MGLKAYLLKRLVYTIVLVFFVLKLCREETGPSTTFSVRGIE